MKKLIALICLAFAFSTQAFAGAQQEKMKGCNAEAKGMKGDERKAFMSKCLKKDYVLKSDAAPAKAEAKPAAKAEAKAEAKPAAKAEAKAEAKPAAKAEAKAEAKPAAKAEAKPAAKAEAKPAVDAKPVAKADAAPVKQQDKMKNCNAEAKTKELQGDERKKFMSTCLKG